MPLTDLIAANDPGMDDFFSAGLAGSSFDGKLYGLPYLVHPGNPACVIFNLDMLDEKGLQAPTDEWAVDEYVEMSAKLTDLDKQISGTSYMPGSHYDFCSLARTFGGDIMAEENKKFALATDPKSVEACHWAVDLRAKYHCAPLREESEGIQFAAGRLGTATLGVYAVKGQEKTIGDKFPYHVVLFPKGPTGIRGYQGFVECFSILSESKHPQEAFDLVVVETST